MIAYIIIFTHRVVSGLQNGAGYSKNRNRLHFFTGLLALLNVVFSVYYYSLAIVILSAISAIAAIAMSYVFFVKERKKWMDIHLIERVITDTMTVAAIVAGIDLLIIICTVYPALILHKGFINLGSKLSFFDNRTNDKSGKTYSLLGYNLPRIANTDIRLALAVLSLILLVLYFLFDPFKFSAIDIINRIFN